MSATDFIAELASDEEYQRRIAERQRVASENTQKMDELFAPTRQQLAAIGIFIDSISELLDSSQDLSDAVGILVEQIRIAEDQHFKELLVRSLTKPWARPAAARPLIREFKNDSLPLSEHSLLRWAIGNALDVVADDSIYDELAELLVDRRYGKDREMIALAMRNMTDLMACQALLSVIDDESISGHVIQALRTLGCTEARSAIEPFTMHEKTWWKNEAKKAIVEFDKIEARGQ